jgi:hypothetical protein
MTATHGQEAERRYPITIAEWPSKNGELVRISLSRFNKYFMIDIRTWWRATNGNFMPGRRGLTLPVRHLPNLAAGFVRALEHAKLLGLV